MTVKSLTQMTKAELITRIRQQSSEIEELHRQLESYTSAAITSSAITLDQQISAIITAQSTRIRELEQKLLELTQIL